jgi:hypothetical protein
VASAAYSPPYETRGFGSDTTAYDDAGSAAGSRLFERWAGQGLGGGPASSRLTSFVGGDGAQAGGYANAGTNGYGANSAYNGFPEADGSINHEPPLTHATRTRRTAPNALRALRELSPGCDARARAAVSFFNIFRRV